MWEGTALDRHASRRKIIAAVIICILVAALCVAGIWYWLAKRSSSPFPAQIRNNTTLTLFYPTTLPEGYMLEPTSIKRTDEVITYVAKKGSEYINFSIQPRADKFDFTTFYSQVLVKSFKFTTPLGEAAVGSMQSTGNSVGSLINGDTWLIVSTEGQIKPSEVQEIITYLKSD